MIALVDLVKDPYQRQARVVPGLLVILPLLLPLVCIFGSRNPVLTGVAALLGGCGALYLLASVARGRGKKLEEKLVASWGGMPTTISLRHRDRFLDRVTKQRYHGLIFYKLGIAMPMASEESADPALGDEKYVAASKRLRERTRDTKGPLLKENIAYGFHRNMLAMKPVGITFCLIAIVWGLLISGVLQPVSPYLVLANTLNPGLTAGLTWVIAVCLLAIWVFYFDENTVRRMGFVYAERLLECLETIRAKR